MKAKVTEKPLRKELQAIDYEECGSKGTDSKRRSGRSLIILKSERL
jgi:hypothetical protein